MNITLHVPLSRRILKFEGPVYPSNQTPRKETRFRGRTVRKGGVGIKEKGREIRRVTEEGDGTCMDFEGVQIQLLHNNKLLLII